MAKKTYFKEGRLEVTNDFVRARNRSIALSTLESVHVGRRLFLGALALCGGMIGFGLVFGDLLYLQEIAFVVVVGALALVLAWNFGTFTIYSKLTGSRGWSVNWRINPLHQMRDAVETALEEQSMRKRRAQKGAVVEPEEDEEEEV